ncbi:MCU domain-containing protein [Mycena chlorophos]|uniref:MCU domain-containing protein n=1 Tax=Mycena chlorophos TaxID=658473 RepID=A0A8H6TMX0_MYCCL|nr:MCU domain-containing protein [Mycena chlorophos]
MDSDEYAEPLNVYHCVNAASFTLLLYDYALTLDWEVSRYWSRRSNLNWPTFLFYLNRYGTLAGNIPVALTAFWTSVPTASKVKVRVFVSASSQTHLFTSCKALDSYHQYFVILSQIVIGLLLLLRTYALYDRSRLVLAFMLAFGVGMIALGLWATLDSHHSSPQGSPVVALYIGCEYLVPKEESTSLIVAWLAMGAYDVMIFGLTLARALTEWFRTRSARVPGEGRSSTPTLLQVLMRDGTIYFGVIALFNFGNIITFAIGGPTTRGILDTATNIISSLAISRLMLNLRDPSLSHAYRHHDPSESAPYSSSGGSRLPLSTVDAGVFSTHLDMDAELREMNADTTTVELDLDGSGSRVYDSGPSLALSSLRG